MQVTTRDETGVLMALSTVQVLLLSSGVSEINPPGNTIYERVALETPHYEDTISGGTYNCQGNVYALSIRRPYVFELIDMNGKSLNANRQLSLMGSSSQSIDTTIPYKVDSSTPAYLVIHQEDDVSKESGLSR